jgi:excisionase family DNA binding protein
MEGLPVTATELLTAAEAASRLKIDKRTLLRWSRERRIESVRISNKKILFSADAIERFVQSRTNGVESPPLNHQRAGRKSDGPIATKKGGDRGTSGELWKDLRKEVKQWR